MSEPDSYPSLVTTRSVLSRQATSRRSDDHLWYGNLLSLSPNYYYDLTSHTNFFSVRASPRPLTSGLPPT